MDATPRSTAVTVLVPGPLLAWAGGASRLAIEAETLRAVLAALERRHPELYRGVCDETGQVRRHINLFINNHHMRDRDGLDTPLRPGDVISILPAVSGG
jgi:molybdopterin synthase sulfur carrier subunit